MIAVSSPDAAYAIERTLFMQPMTLRNARHLIMVVSNRETGEVYYAKDTEYLPKAIYDTDNGWIATGSFLWDGTDLDGQRSSERTPRSMSTTMPTLPTARTNSAR